MIEQRHLDEWVRFSGVSEAIARLNIESLEDSTEIAHRLNWSVKRWHGWDGGAGWWVSGVNPVSGEVDFASGQFKPDKPLQMGTKKDGTPSYRKYVSPCKSSNDKGFNSHPLFLRMGDSDYWQKIHADLSIPIWDLEGAKKAGCLLSRGKAAIATPGVNNGQKKGRLHPNLLRFAQPGRKIVLAYDMDWKTNINVRKALREKAVLYSEQGCAVYVARWEQGKGIDDAIVAGTNIEEIESSLLTFKEWLDFLKDNPEEVIQSACEQLGLDPADEVKDVTFDAHCYKRLFAEGGSKFIVLDDSFYQYTGAGYWKRLDDRKVHKLISAYSMRAFKIRTGSNGQLSASYPFSKDGQVKSAFSFCRNMLSISRSEMPANEHLLCFSNGTVDLRTGELIDHDPLHYLTSAISSDYKPGAACPSVFLEFISSAYGGDLLPVIRACTSMLLDPTANYGKFVHLIGASGSGKGTLLHVWQEMFGLDNHRSSNSFSDLATSELRHQNLTGARLFAVPDIGGYQKSMKAFYSLVDNEPLSGRALFSANGYQAKWNCRFVIASVDHLRIENSGDGWDRRVIPLPTRPRRSPPDPALKTKLTEVKADIISWAIAMSKIERDHILNNLHQYESIELVRGDAAIAGDPIKYFVDTCLRPSSSGQRIHSFQLHTYYQAFCQVHGFQSSGMSSFSSHLRLVIPDHYRSRRRATKDEDPLREIIPPHWVNLEPIEGIFEQTSLEGDFAKCNKSKCREGGLTLFSEFASRGWLDEKDLLSVQKEVLMLQQAPKRSDGSATLDQVADPQIRPYSQGFQDFGSAGSSDLSQQSSNEICDQNIDCDSQHNVSDRDQKYIDFEGRQIRRSASSSANGKTYPEQFSLGSASGSSTIGEEKTNGSQSEFQADLPDSQVADPSDLLGANGHTESSPYSGGDIPKPDGVKREAWNRHLENIRRYGMDYVTPFEDEDFEDE